MHAHITDRLSADAIGHTTDNRTTCNRSTCWLLRSERHAQCQQRSDECIPSKSHGAPYG